MKFMNIFDGKDKKEAIEKGTDVEGDFLESKRHTEYQEVPNLDEYDNPKEFNDKAKEHFWTELDNIYTKYVMPCYQGMSIMQFRALEYVTQDVERTLLFIKCCGLKVGKVEEIKVYYVPNVKTIFKNSVINRDLVYKVSRGSTTVTPINADSVNGIYLYSLKGVLSVCGVRVTDVELTDPVTDFEREYSGVELLDRGYRFAENIES